MKQLSNNNVLEFTKIMISNLNLTARDTASSLGVPLEMKSDYGMKLKEFLINVSIQLNTNILDSRADIYQIAIFYFDQFSATQEWMETIEEEINNELKRVDKAC